MINNNEDRRIRKTNKAIKKALIKLMLEKDISQITIKEISEEADINRATFYSHFYDIYAVLEQIEDDIIHTLYELIDEFDFESLSNSPLPFLLRLSEFLNENREFNQHLLLNESSVSFLDKLKKLLKNKIMEDNEKNIDKKHREAFSCGISFISSGTIDLYKEWFKGNIHMTLEELSKTINYLIMDGARFLIKR